MKLLKVKVTGLPLLDESLEIEFVAQQRVSDENAEAMYQVLPKIYQNNVVSVIGINASGKTTLLKILSFVISMLNNESINTIACREILDGMVEQVLFESYFSTENQQIHYLKTIIGRKKGRYYIKDEWLYSKDDTKVKSKKSLYQFEHLPVSMVRDANEAFLLEDVSIMVALNKQNLGGIQMVDMLQHTNVNQLSVLESFPPEVIVFFDPSVEYLRLDQSRKPSDIRLKFRGEEEIVLNHPAELNRYLSSGTIKGINTFVYAMKTFESGGYLIVDELENHFNKEIVSTLIRFYRDKRVNPKGAVLIFSTHYAELLDEFERNDMIYIVRNRNGITAQNLASILKRNDIKKSEAYQSGFLEGTVPLYESYMDLKRVLLAANLEGQS